MTRSREILTRIQLKIWQNKPLSELTDKECDDCLAYVQKVTGTYYIA